MDSNFREKILPVPQGVDRPLWSVMIPTYNCASYLRNTLESVLAQDPGPEMMQIEVIDDCSTLDDPEAVVNELGKGRVQFYRQPKNGGFINNFNTCLKRSRGHLVHMLHGDDWVKPTFYATLQKAFETQPEIGAAFCRQISIREDNQQTWIPRPEQPESGIIQDWIERIGVRCIIQPPTMVVRRSVYEQLGGFDKRICCTGEDWEMWVRVSANFPVWYEVEPLAYYRVHPASLTKRCQRTGQNLRDLRQAVAINRESLPAQVKNTITRKAYENWANYGLNIAQKMLLVGDIEGALTQIRESLKCRVTPNTLKMAGRLYLRTAKVTLQRQFLKA